MYSGIGASICAVSYDGITSYVLRDEDRIPWDAANADWIPCGVVDADRIPRDDRFTELKLTVGIWEVDADEDRIPCGGAGADDDADVTGVIGYGGGGGLDEGCHDEYSEGVDGWFIPYCSLKLGK